MRGGGDRHLLTLVGHKPERGAATGGPSSARQRAEAVPSAGGRMLLYRLFSHDGLGNFSLIDEFRAQSDEDAAKSIVRWHARPLELWQSSRIVNRWA